ncbi:uncharacterized protein ACMZJ9_016836 [Mantella aurantiaca]
MRQVMTLDLRNLPHSIDSQCIEAGRSGCQRYQQQRSPISTNAVPLLRVPCAKNTICISECNSIIVQASTNQINVSGLAGGFVLQNITYINETAVTASDNSSSNISLMNFTSGTLYIIHYGNVSNSCCYNVTTKPLSVKSPQSYNVTSTSVSLNWSKPDEYQNNYTYRVQTNVTSSSTLTNNTIVTNESATIVSLTPGETYTFLVYTRAADNVTESDPESLTTCTVPGQAVGVTVNNYKSVNSLAVNWTAPAGIVSYYNVTITGDVTNTTQTNITQANFTGLSPGRNYTVTVQTVIGSCSSPIITVTEATYPSPPGNITFITIGTNTIALSWGEPVNMTGVTISYNITYYWDASSPNTTTSNSTNVTLLSLKSGSNYTVTVVTVGVRGYQSTPVSGSIFTIPGQAVGVTVNNYKSVNSLAVNWTAPAGKVSYYNVTIKGDVTNTTQTNITQANFTGLSPGRNYTVTVQTFSGSCSSAIITVTEATFPGQAVGVTVNNYKSMNSLAVNWTAPAGKVSYYNVTITGDVNRTIQINITQANFTNLLPGRNYTVTVQTFSGSCNSAIITVTEATYPSPPGNITFITIGTNTTTLSWGEPVNMTGVTKSYSINYYWNASSFNTISNSANVTLVSLKSGSNYTVTVVTVGVRGYQSTAVSRSVFTIPGQAVGVTVNNSKSVNSLAVNWTAPAGKVSYYNVTITGDVNKTIQINTTQANFTNLLPGRNYTVTVQTFSGSCNSAVFTVTEATYPSPPGNITFITIGTNTTTLSWGEPVNMTGVTKTYSINYYWNASSPNTTTSNSTNVTLLSLKSGSNYTVTVVTVGVRGYQSTPVSRSMFTKPLPVKSPQSYNLTTTSVSLNWSKPDEYQSSYSYRVQTNVTSSSTLINNMIVTNESATIVSLTPGETYTFLVYTRAADNVTESDPVSLIICTAPGQAVGVTVNNSNSVNSLAVNWTAPTGNVSYYNVTITGDVNNTIQTNITQANFTNLLPGRNYTVTVQTVSGSCSSAITVREATYPTPPGNITFITIGASTTTLSWGEPVNMTGVTKSYNINYYWNASSPNTMTSNSTNVTLLNLKSGSNYTVTVVTVGVREYQSSAVSGSMVTKPFPVKSPQYYNVTSTSAFLNWSKPDEYQNSYSYRVQTNVTSPSTLINNMIVTNESITIVSLTPGETYTFLVYTRAADNVTESDPVSLTTCTVPGQTVGVTVNNSKSVNSLAVNWTAPAGKASYYNVTITGDVNNTIQANLTQANFTNLLPGRNYTVTVQTFSGSCNSAISTVTEATYPSPPGNITFITIGTNTTTLSWGEPVNMTGVTKSYNINYYWDASSPITMTSNATNVTLLSLKSGSNYTVTVVTVGVQGYQSTTVSRSVFTKPLSAKSPQSYYVTSTSVFLNWSKPDEYQSPYSYRVQTNVTSSSTQINNTIVTNESATIVSLTPGETYTFLIYTRAADNVTESDPVSLTTCTVPGQAVGVMVNSYKSVNSLAVNWPAPAGKVSYYNVTITGNVNNTIQTNITQVNFTGLSPGRNYTVTVQTFSGNCNSAIITVTEATYPSPPGNITFITTGTNTTTLSWGEPVNMTDVTKSYNINYYWNSSSPNTTTSNFTNVTLLSLKSGSNYTVTVVTVGVRGYQSMAVSGSVFTKPLPVKSPQSYNVTTTSVSLNWSKPDEYQNNYSYRVQTNVTSPTTLTNNTIVTNEPATIVSLTPGETYTFLVYTRAADNVTESDPVSLTNCTVPGQAVGVTVNNYKSVNSLAVNWTAPAGKASYYNVTITGDVNNTIQTNTTQANFTGLSPGRNYTVTVQTFSGNCRSAIITVTEATYPSSPGNITFVTIGTNTTTLSWGEPGNMTGVTKTYNISYYWNSSSLNTTSNSANVTLLNLKSGSNYTVAVVTVGVQGYQSTPVSGSVFTKPLPVKSPQSYNVTTTSVSLNWSKPDEYQSSYSYRVQTNVTSLSTLTNNTIVTNESATIVSLMPGETYTFLVYTRAADNVTESDPVSLTTCTVPGQAVGVTVNNYNSVNSLAVNWTAPAGKVSYYTVNITGDVNRTIQTNTTQANFTGLSPGRNYTVTVQTFSGSCNSAIITVTEATYPNPSGSIAFNTIGANTITLSWMEPTNMTGLFPSYNITYWNASSSSNWTQISYTNSVTLQSLTSGTNYTISVVTVGVRGYQSTPVTASVYTKPWTVQDLKFNVTSNTVSLSWRQPIEHQSKYSYRVLTNVTSSSTRINNTIVYSEMATVVNLIAGETYTFTLYVRAADNATESDPVSLTTCTGPGQVSITSLNNYHSIDTLGVIWTASTGKMDYYIINIMGDVKNTAKTNSTQTNFTSLLPGREYTVSVQTVSGNCNQTSSSVTEATYPTPPGSVSFTMTGTKNVTLSWGEPVNMTGGVVKLYNITYWNSSSPTIIAGNVTSNPTTVTLQNLASGSNYTMSVVTVGARGYQSTLVTASVCTKPISVTSPTIANNSTNIVFLNWTQPDEYQSSYTYRVQTNLTSPSTLINNTIVTSGSATIYNLKAGETYTFLIYTRSTCNTTESDPTTITDCTLPEQAVNATADSYKSVNSLAVNWTAPVGKVSYYNVTITGNGTNTMQTNTTQANFTGLSPGREYNITILTVSSSCSQAAPMLTQATYPSPPGSITFTMIGTKNVTLSWVDPVNMTGVVKSYNITYSNSSSPTIIVSNVTSSATNVTLQNMISGSNYTISVVTVGVRGYQSTPVTTLVCTKPISVKSLQIVDKSNNSVSLNWTQLDEYQSSYTYRVQTNINSSSTLINNTIATSGSATIYNLTAGETYTFLIYTRSGCNTTESDPTTITNCTLPGQAVNATVDSYKSVNSLAVNWMAPAGIVSYYNVTITGDVTNTIQTYTTQANFTGLSPGREYNVTILTVSSSCSQTAPMVTQATYPTPPRSVSFTMIGTKNVTLSWADPENMTGSVVKSYYITYWNSSSNSIIAGNVTSNPTTVTLQNLTSGSNYTMSVLTVGVRGYQSTPVTALVCTKPISVKPLQIVAKFNDSVSLNWAQPDEYQNSYTYRVQTNINSSSTLINNTIVTSGSATIFNLTAGETYTFLVYTRSACNTTESDPTTITNCTRKFNYPECGRDIKEIAHSFQTCSEIKAFQSCVPGQAVSPTVDSKESVNSLEVNWTPPAGIVSYYNVTITGDVTNTTQTNSAKVEFTGLSPGREYNVTILTVSSSCSQAANVLTQATYPTSPGNISFVTIGTKIVTLSWGEPVNMTGVVKSYNITYWNSSSPSIIAGYVISNTANVTLQNLISGTSYTMSVVTVGVRGYHSKPVSASVCTKPISVKSLTFIGKSIDSIALSWVQPEEYQSSYTYRVQTYLTSTSTLIIPEHVVGATANSTVDTVAVNWTAPAGKWSYYNVTITGDITNTIQTNNTHVNFTGLSPGREYNVIILTVSSSCSQAAPELTQATYPNPPSLLAVLMVDTHSITISWEPMSVQSLQNASATRNVSLNWSKPYEYQSSYSYRVQTIVTSSSTLINNMIVTNESATIVSLTPGETYTFLVYTRAADNVTESDPVLLTTCTDPEAMSDFSATGVGSTTISLKWKCPEEKFNSFSLDVTSKTSTETTNVPRNCISGATQEYVKSGLSPYTDYTIKARTLSCDRASKAMQIVIKTLMAAPIPPTNTPVILNPSQSFDHFDYTFDLFDATNGPVGTYAMIVTSDASAVGKSPSMDILTKTYDNFKSKSSSAYVALITNVNTNARRARATTGTQTVRIGDSTRNGPYYNAPLEASTAYSVAVVGFTTIAYNTDGTIDTSNSDGKPGLFSQPVSTTANSGLIAGAVIGSLLGILVVVAVGLFIWYRRRKGAKTEENDIGFAPVKTQKKSSLGMSAASFLKHCDKQQADCNLGFSEEYENLAPVGKRLPKTAADHPDNREKNRYTNVLPYDLSRVILSTDGTSTDDYINANFIPGYRNAKEFIAAQGPLPRTINDFWRMIWEKDVRTIVMLTRCVEIGKVKCEEYWPSRSSRTFGNLFVSLSNETVLPDWTVRDFAVTHKQTRQNKQVRHFHFTAWPDHGVPNATDDLIQFRNLMREYTAIYSPPTSPIVVHCSAGVGRTGTLIALDRIIKQIEDEDKVDVYGVVYDLRMHRDLMVQTENQYVFLNQCARDFINTRNNPNPESQNSESIYQNADTIYQNVSSIYPNINRTNL